MSRSAPAVRGLATYGRGVAMGTSDMLCVVTGTGVGIGKVCEVAGMATVAGPPASAGAARGGVVGSLTGLALAGRACDMTGWAIGTVVGTVGIVDMPWR